MQENGDNRHLKADAERQQHFCQQHHTGAVTEGRDGAWRLEGQEPLKEERRHAVAESAAGEKQDDRKRHHNHRSAPFAFGQCRFDETPPLEQNPRRRQQYRRNERDLKVHDEAFHRVQRDHAANDLILLEGLANWPGKEF